MKTIRIMVTCLLFLLFVSISYGQKKEQVKENDLKEMPSIVGGVGELAKVIKYPPEAKEKGIQGKVYLGITIEDGTVSKITVLKSDNEIFNEASIEAVRQIKFTPAKDKNDKEVSATITLPINYKLDEKHTK